MLVKYVPLAVLLLAGCGSQAPESPLASLTVRTIPAGATCAWSQDGQAGTLGPTPTSIMVDWSRGDFLLECAKDGLYRHARLDGPATQRWAINQGAALGPLGMLLTETVMRPPPGPPFVILPLL